MRDDDVRSSCFAALDVLQAQHGPELPFAALARGFTFRGRRVPFLNRAYGIYRAAEVQRGPAALSVIGIDADYTVRISRRLLDEEDGPMLELLKGFEQQAISIPRASAMRPDRERLAERFERFLERAR